MLARSDLHCAGASREKAAFEVFLRRILPALWSTDGPDRCVGVKCALAVGHQWCRRELHLVLLRALCAFAVLERRFSNRRAHQQGQRDVVFPRDSGDGGRRGEWLSTWRDDAGLRAGAYGARGYCRSYLRLRLLLWVSWMRCDSLPLLCCRRAEETTMLPWTFPHIFPYRSGIDLETVT